MPALIFLRRKWLIACDDFVIFGGIEALLRIIWCVVVSVLILMKIQNCGQSTIINYFLYACVGDLIPSVCLAITIAIVSARGSVLQVEKRQALSTLLFIKLLFLLYDIALASFGVWCYMNFENICPVKENFIEITTVTIWIYVILVIIGLFVCYDTLGSTRFWDKEASPNALNFFKRAQFIWKMRLKLFCCCADISEDNDDFIYVEISTFLASFLNGIDLVPTDILAGIITLSRKHVLERKKHLVSQVPYSLALLENTPVPDWMTPNNALYFLRIAKSTYGWLPFFDVLHPWNLCILSPKARCCMNCCSPTDETRVDNCCYLNTAAVKKITHFTDADIIYASFENKIHEPAFYIAVDHFKKCIVISIRGTRSFSDLLTDIDGETLNFPSETDIKYKCHRGALKSAIFVKKKISEMNILQLAFAENPTYTLAVTGHSLGGSVAAILALILQPKYPDLQCYSYGPLAVMSASGIQHSLSYIFSIVVGEDMAPRLNVSSCGDLRKQIIESLKECKTSKYRILLGACWYHVQKYLKMQPHTLPHEVHDNKLCENHAEEPPVPTELNTLEDSKLYAPGRILYFERKHWYNPYWLTGLNLQNIIVNPHMMSDHQPHKIQKTLENYIKSIEDTFQQTVLLE